MAKLDTYRFVLIDSYCENSYLADQVADLPPKMVIFLFVPIHSYSENSYLAGQVADLPPSKMAILNLYL